MKKKTLKAFKKRVYNQEPKIEEIIKKLRCDGLTDDEIASAFNISPVTVRRVCRLYIQKVDVDKFIELWKKDLPWPAIAKIMGVSISTAKRYKSKYCKELKKKRICYSCGCKFQTNNEGRVNCHDCTPINTEMYLLHLKKVERMGLGNELQRLRVEKEEKKAEREKERKGIVDGHIL